MIGNAPPLVLKHLLKMGLESHSFPLLVSYFEDRRMIVKWHGAESSLKRLKKGEVPKVDFGVF